MTAPHPASSRLRSGVAGLLLAGIAVAGGVLLARRPVEAPARPAATSLVLDETFELPASTPADRRILVNGPTRIEVHVEAGAPVRTRFGPAGPATAEAEGGPDPALTAEIPSTPSGAKGEVLAYANGIHVLRVERPAGAVGPLRVRLVVHRHAGP
jgi:hypothetical protein